MTQLGGNRCAFRMDRISQLAQPGDRLGPDNIQLALPGRWVTLPDTPRLSFPPRQQPPSGGNHQPICDQVVYSHALEVAAFRMRFCSVTGPRVAGANGSVPGIAGGARDHDAAWNCFRKSQLLIVVGCSRSQA